MPGRSPSGNSHGAVRWNESAPDQFSVEESNDIEATVITTLDADHSDGWGTYYLDLVRELITQYRQGRASPQ